MRQYIEIEIEGLDRFREKIEAEWYFESDRERVEHRIEKIEKLGKKVFEAKEIVRARMNDTIYALDLIEDEIEEELEKLRQEKEGLKNE